MARCVGLSPYSEAERVNAAETNGVSKMDVPELHAVGRPRNAAELLSNRRSFANAIANCIGSVKYAGRSLVSLVSFFPGIPHSEDIPDAERLSARHIMALKSEEKKKTRAVGIDYSAYVKVHGAAQFRGALLVVPDPQELVQAGHAPWPSLLSA